MARVVCQQGEVASVYQGEEFVTAGKARADFGGYEMTGEEGYSVIIPEGTVIAESDDPVVNPRNAMSVGGISGIDGTSVGDKSGMGNMYDLSGRKVQNRVPGKIYIVNGQKIVSK